MQAIQKKYKGKTDPASREAMSRETMALYSEHGTNPFASCLPILLQSPIFFALFRVLICCRRHRRRHHGPDRPDVAAELAAQAEAATIFGAPLSGTFMQRRRQLAHPDRHRGPDHRDVRDDVPHAAPADDEEHAAAGARKPDGTAAEDPDLRPAADLRVLRCQLPDRCPHLLDHDEPLVDGPAVLRDPEHAGAGLCRRRSP